MHFCNLQLQVRRTYAEGELSTGCIAIPGHHHDHVVMIMSINNNIMLAVAEEEEEENGHKHLGLIGCQPLNPQ